MSSRNDCLALSSRQSNKCKIFTRYCKLLKVRVENANVRHLTKRPSKDYHNLSEFLSLCKFPNVKSYSKRMKNIVMFSFERYIFRIYLEYFPLGVTFKRISLRKLEYFFECSIVLIKKKNVRTSFAIVSQIILSCVK